MEIALFIEGNGFGHAARMYPFAKLTGAKVISFDKGIDYMRERGYNNLVEIKKPYPFVVNGKEFDLMKSVGEMLKNFDVHTTKLLTEELKDVEVIVVDSTLLGLLIGKALRKKVVFIANNTDVSVFFSGAKAIMLKKTVERLLNMVDVLAICDFPPPYTISYENLLMNDKEKVFLGPLVDVSDVKRGKEEYVLIGGGAGGELAQYGYLWRSIGYPVAAEFLGDGKYRDLLNNAKVVVNHGGHSSIMEAVMLGIPQVVIPKENYGERVNNAKGVERLRLGVRLHEKYINQLVIEKAIEDALALKDDVLRFSKWAKRFRGNERLKEIVESLLRR